jgi:hypothetical protein
MIAFRKLFPCLAIGAFLIGTANEARCDLIYGTPIIASGQTESGFAGIEFVPGGVCYSDVFLGFNQIPICAAGLPQEPTIQYPPVLHFFAVPTCCTVAPEPGLQPIPEPSMVYIMWAIFVVVAIRRAVARWV